MSKPTIETLETSFTKELNPVRTVVDVNGRTIRYKTLTILEQARLARVLGENANNSLYFSMLATACAVLDIDGDQGPPKTKQSFLEARLEWLADAGWDAMVAFNRSLMENEEPEDKTQAAKS